jgi:hypothetical protein
MAIGRDDAVDFGSRKGEGRIKGAIWRDRSNDSLHLRDFDKMVCQVHIRERLSSFLKGGMSSMKIVIENDKKMVISVRKIRIGVI